MRRRLALELVDVGTRAVERRPGDGDVVPSALHGTLGALSRLRFAGGRELSLRCDQLLAAPVEDGSPRGHRLPPTHLLVAVPREEGVDRLALRTDRGHLRVEVAQTGRVRGQLAVKACVVLQVGDRSRVHPGSLTSSDVVRRDALTAGREIPLLGGGERARGGRPVARRAGGRTAVTTSASPALPPNAWLRWDAAARHVPTETRDLLEIGCGQGGFGVRFARRFRYVGIDLDETSVSLARRRLEQHGVQGDVRLGDLSVLSSDETFDVVCAFEVLEHLEEDTRALRAWAGRLRPGGTLVVSVPAGSERYAAWDELAGHYRRYDPPGLLHLLADAGLTGARATVYGWPAGYALEALRNGIARRRGTASAGGSFEERTSASGRLLSLPDGARALVPYLVMRPFMLLQRMQPGRGTGLVASAQKPY